MNFRIRLKVIRRPSLSFHLRTNKQGVRESVCMACHGRLPDADDADSLMRVVKAHICPQMIVFEGSLEDLADTH